MNWRRTKKALKKLRIGRPITRKEREVCFKFVRKIFRKNIRNFIKNTEKFVSEAVIKFAEIYERLRNQPGVIFGEESAFMFSEVKRDGHE